MQALQPTDNRYYVVITVVCTHTPKAKNALHTWWSSHDATSPAPPRDRHYRQRSTEHGRRHHYPPPRAVVSIQIVTLDGRRHVLTVVAASVASVFLVFTVRVEVVMKVVVEMILDTL